MPVVESYPSIVGIAQVAQAAGQGRYNQWLAEFNTRANIAKTNALMGGFSAGANLGMSTARMWQQQQQFNQRQGFIESQAAERLEKDTKYTEAMLPALTPYMQKLYPHLNEEQIGEVIGSMSRQQIENAVNTQGNAGKAMGWWDLMGSPQALRKQAKSTYDKMVTGQQHQNARVQSRLEPLFQRMRDSDLNLTEEAVQREIARILREEGEAEGGTSFQEKTDQRTASIHDDNGNLVSKLVQVGPNKVMEVRMPQPKEGKPPVPAWDKYGAAHAAVEKIHKRRVDNWEKQYARMPEGYEGYGGGTPSIPWQDVATYVDTDPVTGRVRYLRSRRDDEFVETHGVVALPDGRLMTPTNIPPYPRWDDSVGQVPGAAAILGGGQTAGPAAGGQPYRLRFPGELGAPGTETMRPGPGPGPGPAPASGDQPQVTPAPPGWRRGSGGQLMPIPLEKPDVPLVPPGGLGEQINRMGIDPLTGMLNRPLMTGRAGPVQLQEPEERAQARSSVLKSLETKTPGSSKAIRTLIGAHQRIGQGLPGGELTEFNQRFEARVRQGVEDSVIESEFAPVLLRAEERRELRKAITNFGAKTAVSPAGIGAGGGPPELRGRKMSTEQRIESSLKGEDLASYRGIKKAFDRDRKMVTRIAAEAVRATPPGNRVDIANIPVLTTEQFDRGVQDGQIKVGDVFLTPRNNIVFVTQKTIFLSERRVRGLGGIPLPPRPPATPWEQLYQGPGR